MVHSLCICVIAWPSIKKKNFISQGFITRLIFEEKDKRSKSRERLLRILQKKKRAVKAPPAQEAEIRDLRRTVAEMRDKIQSQEEEPTELRGLNRDLQKELLRKTKEGKCN